MRLWKKLGARMICAERRRRNEEVDCVLCDGVIVVLELGFML